MQANQPGLDILDQETRALLESLDRKDPRRKMVEHFLLPGLAGDKFSAGEKAGINEAIGRQLRSQVIETTRLPDGRGGWRRSKSEPWKVLGEEESWFGAKAEGSTHAN